MSSTAALDVLAEIIQTNSVWNYEYARKLGRAIVADRRIAVIELPVEQVIQFHSSRTPEMMRHCAAALLQAANTAELTR